LRFFDSLGQLALMFFLDDQLPDLFYHQVLNVEDEHPHQHHGLNFFRLFCALVDGPQDYSDALKVSLPRRAAHI
jgi:membrane carboxypeptidase/penicillin-binding protein PbpC